MKGYADLLVERPAIQTKRGSVLDSLDFKSSRKAKVKQKRRIYPKAGESSLPPGNTSEWANRYRQLVAFKEREGHTHIPGTMPALSHWVTNQRKNADKLHPDQIEHLLDIQFPFREDDQAWFTSWRALKNYREREGTTYILPQRKDLSQLAVWCQWQRSKRSHAWMNAHQEFLLNEIGFDWNGSEARWQWVYSRARRFYEQHGHWGIKPEPMLQRWFKNQRDSFLKSKLSPRHKALLDSIHFLWVPAKTVRGENEAYLAAVRKYHKQYGHANIPANWPDRKLVCWLARQRSAYKNNSLNPQIVRQLAEMGIFWDRSEQMWDYRISLLCEFHQQNGHWQIPFRHKLARFMRNVQKAYAKGHLHPHHRRKLEQLGFESNPVTPRRPLPYRESVNSLGCFLYGI